VAVETRAGLNRGVLAALVAMAVAVFVIANDVTALAVALPNIEADFDSDVDTVQWVINAYAVIFGVFIVTGGRLADSYGRRRCFFVGAAIFAAFSLLAGLAPSVAWLIVARALMGVGGAMMWPAVLGMTYSVLPKDRSALAGGVVLGAAGFGNAAGPLLGGTLTDALSWRYILFLNLPIALVACLAIRRFIAESTDPAADKSIDYPGIATLTGGLVALLVALDEGGDIGWTDPWVIALLSLCILLLVGFVMVERSARSTALVPADVRASHQFRRIAMAVLLMSVAFFSALMYLPQFMEKILGWSAFAAGLGLLPMMVVFASASFVAGRLYERFGARSVIVTGAACLVIGALLISAASSWSSFQSLIPGMALLGAGVGLFLSSATTLGVRTLGEARSGLAGGLIYMFQVAGGSIGLALTTTVFTVASDSSLGSASADQKLPLTAQDQDAVQGILAGTESAAEVTRRLSSSAAAQVESIVRDGFANGMRWAFAFVALLTIAGLLITVTSIRTSRDTSNA
jgi:EmrB/QacA subfamily drug resistance transporter